MMKYKSIWIGYKNSISYTLVGTLASLFFSICLAYPMSDKSFAPRKYLMIIFMISMYFGGGVIPTYLVLRSLLTASKLVDELTYDPEYVEIALQQAQLMKYSTIILASVPMLCVYPFIQRYFIKGVMVGAVKG